MMRATLTGCTVGDVVRDHEHEGAGLADLNGSRRNGDRLLLAEGQPHLHQRAGPQQFVGVRHGGANRHRAGRGIDRVLDHRDLAAACPLSPGMIASIVAVSLVMRLPQFGRIALRQPEGDVDRRDLDDGRERIRIGLAAKLPTLTLAMLTRPVIGARMNV